MLKRRRFLKIASLGSLAMALPASAFLVFKSTEDIAYDIIKNELSYLNLDEDGLRQYVSDYLRMDNPNLLGKLKWKSYYVMNFNSNDSNNVRYLVSYYLLCSNFFLNKMDESRPVKYLGINHQYTSPCSSHFSFLIYPPKGNNIAS
jgi:hypothetical protein